MPPPENILTNDSVIDMIKEKVPVSLVLSQIRSEKTNFVLNSTEIIRMTKAGVPEKVIEGMRDPKKIPEQAVPPRRLPFYLRRKPNKPPPPTKQPAASNDSSPPPVQPRNRSDPCSGNAHACARSCSPVRNPRHRQRRGDRRNPVLSILLAADIPAGIEPGTPVRFTVAKDLKVGDMVVIAKGASVTGSIVDAGGKKILGHRRQDDFARGPDREHRRPEDQLARGP